MSAGLLLGSILAVDFIWSVSAFVFLQPQPVSLFFHRFFTLPVWVVYLTAVIVLTVSSVRNSFLFRYAHTVWLRAPRRPTLTVESSVPVTRSIDLTGTAVRSPRDITSATPTSATRSPWSSVV